MSDSPRPYGHADAGARFISSLSHELRTPLAVVVGYAELMQRRNDEDFRREASGRILEAAERLANAIDDLLVVFAIEAGYLPVDLQPVDLEAALRHAIEPFEARHPECALAITAGDDAWPAVYADEEHLGRVLTDLLRNARARADPCELQIAVDADEDSASISVSDNGPGMTPEQLAAAFERLRVPDWSRHVAGATGLELYKVRRLVELQGGTISATNRPRVGSTFTFSLPVARDKPAA